MVGTVQKGTIVNTAIILAAGLGARLNPLTDTVPKCLTEVDGVEILVRQLGVLLCHGVKNVVIVVGHLGHVIIDRLNNYVLPDLNITFITNPDYATTNSASSLFLARKYLVDGAYVIEGDVVFDHQLIGDMQKVNEPKAFWVVDNAKPDDDGAVLITSSKSAQIRKVALLREPLREVSANQFKSVGIHRYTPTYGKAIVQQLEVLYTLGQLAPLTKDEVMGDMLDDAPIFAYHVGDHKWAEIDTRQDIAKAERSLEPTKLVMVIIDGAADNPNHLLGGKTPLEVASMPTLDGMANGGKVGLVQTMYPGLPLGSIVACLGLLGYNPTRYYPNGRASFEAIAQGIQMDEGDIAFRCNWVEVDGDDRVIQATPSKHPTLIMLPDQGDGFSFHMGSGYRNTLIAHSPEFNPEDISFSGPHEHIGEVYTEASNAKNDSERAVLGAASNWFSMGYHPPEHYILWPWSPSTVPHLPSFCKRYDLDGAVVTAMDFLRGIAICARMQADKIDGATGFSDTDLSAKLDATQHALRYNDFVMVHINAPDEESHARNVKGKVDILERIDKVYLDPLMKYLHDHYESNYRIVVLPDHYSHVKDGTHGDKPVPYVMYGEGVRADGVESFSEKAVEGREIIKSYEFLEFLREG